MFSSSSSLLILLSSFFGGSAFAPGTVPSFELGPLLGRASVFRRKHFQTVQLKSSSASEPATSEPPPTSPRGQGSVLRLDMPWSETQSWALRDNLSRYTVQVTVPVDDGDTTMKILTLWRTMSEEVTELSGYPLPFLVERCLELSEESGRASGGGGGGTQRPTLPLVSGEILPFLDDFAFEASGGISGRVYGVPGVADGSRIETTPVGDVHATVPKGFVRTDDGSVIYELGKPLVLGENGYSLEVTSKASNVVLKAGRTLSSALSDAGGIDKVSLDDGNLAKLGGLTAVVLGGALAVDLLSHHLTINVFWV